jgi:hypothetical protein
MLTYVLICVQTCAYAAIHVYMLVYLLTFVLELPEVFQKGAPCHVDVPSFKKRIKFGYDVESCLFEVYRVSILAHGSHWFRCARHREPNKPKTKRAQQNQSQTKPGVPTKTRAQTKTGPNKNWAQTKNGPNKNPSPNRLGNLNDDSCRKIELSGFSCPNYFSKARGGSGGTGGGGKTEGREGGRKKGSTIL